MEYRVNGIKVEWFPQEVVGPKMRALPDDRQRQFAWLMGSGKTPAARAARQAGYSDTSEGCKVQGWRLLHNPAVLEAIDEVARQVLRVLGPRAIQAASELLKDPKHPAHARMIEVILDRTGHAAKTEHKVTVEHTVDTSELEALAVRLAAEVGIDPGKLLGGEKAQASEIKEVKPNGRPANSPLLIEGEVILEVKGNGTGPVTNVRPAAEQQVREDGDIP